MNPSIVFEIKPSQFCIVRFRPKSLENHIKSPEAFNAFIAAISDGAYHNVIADELRTTKFNSLNLEAVSRF